MISVTRFNVNGIVKTKGRPAKGDYYLIVMSDPTNNIETITKRFDTKKEVMDYLKDVEKFTV